MKKHKRIFALLIICIGILCACSHQPDTDIITEAAPAATSETAPPATSETAPETPAQSQASQGRIYLYGEAHGNMRITHKELEIWGEYYAQGMRHLFMELSYADAAYLNLWMHLESDEILLQLMEDGQGTHKADSTFSYFFRTIKEQYPETLIHGIDVNHQYDSTGARYLKYLEDSGVDVHAEVYQLTKENNSQGENFYQTPPGWAYQGAYRENCMSENFIREFEALQGESVMAIMGNAHTNIKSKDYYTGTVPSAGAQLYARYGDRLESTDLSYVADSTEPISLPSTSETSAPVKWSEPLSVEEKVINGKTYTASYFGELEGGWKFWRLEDAYEDFRALEKVDYIPVSRYPMHVEKDQVIYIESIQADGSVKTILTRCDGMRLDGEVVTWVLQTY